MQTDRPTLSYDAFRRHCGERMAGIFRIYGLPEIPGHVLGVLLASPEPMTLGALTELLGAAKSTVSVAARRLEGFGFVLRTRVVGDRRDHYQVQEDMGVLAEHLLKRFVVPEIQASGVMLGEMQEALTSGAGADWPEPAHREILSQRVQALSALTQGSSTFLSSLLLPDGSLNQDRIAELIALLTQLQGESP